MVTRALCATLGTLLALLALGCAPDFGTPQSLVTGPAILAVKGDPAETRPNTSASFTALVVSPDGTMAAPALAWALCLTPKPLDENNIVASDCLGGGDGVMDLGMTGPMATTTIPANACALFGPDPPPQEMGKPPLRPRDPDVTGGYYQPLRVTIGDVTGFELERVTCDLASAGADIATEWGKSYVANANPTLDPLTATRGGQPVDLSAIPGGAKIDFAESWPADAVESFPVFDLTAEALVTQRESMRLSWFATAGQFEHDVTGRDGTDLATDTANTWTAPTTAGVVHLWVVLRDSRGGVDYASYDLTVTP